MPVSKYKKSSQKLRTGFTTGSAAAAAAKAAVHFLLCAEKLSRVNIPLPTSERMSIPIHALNRENNSARVSVIKDAGDDPDCTDKTEIQALAFLQSGVDTLEIALDGGQGVGRVTLAGLPVSIGDAAINPEPRKQICAAVREAAQGFCGKITVLIEVPEGEKLAAKTLNARLGIHGGISILGTQGIVKPYSHDAYKMSILEALDVACAAKLDQIVFSTGRRSEKLYIKAYPMTPALSMIQAADFFGFACRAAVERGLRQIRWAIFFGKLLKQAQGLENTHASYAALDFELLARHCAEAGLPESLLPAVRSANTAQQVFELTMQHGVLPALLRFLSEQASQAIQNFVTTPLDVSYTVFNFDGAVLL